MAAMISLTSATISLVLQILALVLLLAAIALKNKKSYRQHGAAVTIALMMHITTVFGVMMPSFSTFFTSSGTIVYNAAVIISLVHVTFGSIALALGIWLVAVWHFKTDLKNCFKNKKIMRLVLVIWTTSILLGIVMYVMFWTSYLL